MNSPISPGETNMVPRACKGMMAYEEASPLLAEIKDPFREVAISPRKGS